MEKSSIIKKLLGSIDIILLSLSALACVMLLLVCQIWHSLASILSGYIDFMLYVSGGSLLLMLILAATDFYSEFERSCPIPDEVFIIPQVTIVILTIVAAWFGSIFSIGLGIIACCSYARLVQEVCDLCFFVKKDLVSNGKI